MNINIVNETKLKIRARRLTQAVQDIILNLTQLKVRNFKKLHQAPEVTLVFLSAAKMKKINHQYRGKNKATDVLSFSSEDESSIGEIAFCLDVLKKQAKSQGHSLDRELLYMMIHGFLHLLGYDHEKSNREEKLMFKIQDECFERLSYIKIIL
jgi:probable rRNA maturation factor